MEQQLSENPYERNEIWAGEARINEANELPDGVVVTFAPGSKGNLVRLAPDGRYHNVRIALNSAVNCTVNIGAIYVAFGGVTVSFVSNQRWSNRASVSIGDGSIFNGATHVIGALTPGVAVNIGKNCLFSTGVSVRGSSHHGLWDLETGRLLNPEVGIEIGDHVWIGDGVVVLNKAVIPSGSVVGARSVVNKAHSDENALLAGVPASVRRTGVDWTDEFPAHNGGELRGDEV